jgi:hypothetical protein
MIIVDENLIYQTKGTIIIAPLTESFQVLFAPSNVLGRYDFIILGIDKEDTYVFIGHEFFRLSVAFITYR